MASPITTHILDISVGKPAAGVPVQLQYASQSGEWKELGQANTDADGRVKELMAKEELRPGTYRLTFHIADYFAARSIKPFFPKVHLIFDVADAAQHYHVPLLLSPFGYSTYRGS